MYFNICLFQALEVIDTVAEVADVATSIYEIASFQLGELHCQISIVFMIAFSESESEYETLKADQETSSDSAYMMKKESITNDLKIMDAVKTDIQSSRRGLKLITNLLFNQSSFDAANNQEQFETLNTNFQEILKENKKDQDEKQSHLVKEISILTKENENLKEENEAVQKLLKNLMKTQNEETEKRKEETEEVKWLIENLMKSQKEKLNKKQETIMNENQKQDEVISTNSNWINIIAIIMTLLGVQSNLSVRDYTAKIH